MLHFIRNHLVVVLTLDALSNAVSRLKLAVLFKRGIDTGLCDTMEQKA